MSEEMTGSGKIACFPRSSTRSNEVELAYRQNEGRLLQFLRIRLKSDSEAEDAAQQTFLRLWQRREIISNENLVALLFVTARNIACDRLRARSRTARRIDPDEDCWSLVESTANQDAGAHRTLAARQDLALVAKLVQELPEKCRSAFVGYHFHFESYGQIASRLGVTESMARKYVQKAVAYCATRFEELEDWE